jgi:hypothetical protein
LPEKKSAYYFRRVVTLATTNFSTLLLAATCTDDYAGTVSPMRLWINGVEVVAPIEAVTGEGNIVKYFDLTPFTGLFVAGSNTLAFALGNTWASDWDNVAFDIALKGITAPANQTEPARIVSATRTASGMVNLQLTGPAGSTWTLDSSDNVPTWSAVQSVTFDTQGNATQQDNGQNGRPSPTAVFSRFYRLRSP